MNYIDNLLKNNLKGIVSNPNIAPHVKETVLAYEEYNLLKAFYTTFVEHSRYPLSILLSIIFPNLKKEMKRRSFEELSYDFIKTKPYYELIRVISARKLYPIITDRIWERSELSFDKWVAKNLRKEMDFIHVTEHAALATLKKAKDLKITTFYEQPSIHHSAFSKILQTQLTDYQDFNTKSIILLHNADSKRRNIRRDEELSIADYVICNSSFSKKSLISAGINKDKIIVLPLGFPDTELTTPITKKNLQIIFLSAGNLSVGKGSHLLIESWKELKLSDTELWFVGKNNLPEKFMTQLPSSIKFFGNVPRQDLMNMFEKVNVLIHPTLADGFGMVISEAMSHGVPVIATTNCAGPDIIEHHISGLIIPANDKISLKKSIIWCLENPEKLNEMGEQALKKAKSYPWSEYRRRLAAEVSTALKYR